MRGILSYSFVSWLIQSLSLRTNIIIRIRLDFPWSVDLPKLGNWYQMMCEGVCLSLCNPHYVFKNKLLGVIKGAFSLPPLTQALSKDLGWLGKLYRTAASAEWRWAQNAAWVQNGGECRKLRECRLVVSAEWCMIAEWRWV